MIVLYYLFVVLFILVSVVLCFIILVQESKSMGMGASFGGDSGDSLFGTSTPEILKKLTAWLAIVFLGGCILLSFWTGALGQSKTKMNNESEFVQ